ncbi:MAG: HK97 family phage prohead protease [Odoribacter sp.]
MAYTFLLSDESVNCYGTRVLTAGIRTDDFLKNPLMLWNHIRAWSDKDDQVLPIGRWENLRVENGKLYGDAVFDEKDEFAQKIASKVEQKIINACSISISVVTTSDDSTVIVQGQSRPTIMESRLREVSIVDIPANKNSVRLFDEATNREMSFADGVDNFLLPILKNADDMNFKDDALAALDLKEADEKAIIAEIVRLKSADREVTTLRTDKTQLEEKLKVYTDKEVADAKATVIALVDDAVKNRKITASDREDYLALAEKDFERTKKILDAKPEVKELSEGGGSRQSDPWAERFSEIEKNRK